MNVTIVLEYRFSQTPDGRIWAPDTYSYQFWSRYLEIFDSVKVVARIRDIPQALPDWFLASGDAVTFYAIPNYQGPGEYLKQYFKVRAAVRHAIALQDAVLLRVPSQIATLITPGLSALGRPYAVQVVGDPIDVFAPGVVEHPLRPVFRWHGARQLKRQCSAAATASYVTEHTLQRRYPSDAGAFVTHFSDVELSEECFASEPRRLALEQRSFRLLTVGSLAQLYKAPDVLIDAVAECVSGGLQVSLVLVGDGKYRAQMERRVQDRGLGERVRFLGQLPSGEAIIRQLDQADLFVLPSRTEGLPRALIEAMARALPCIGSTAGGIPELLSSEDMVPPNDVAALATMLRATLTKPARLAEMSERNLKKAREYGAAVLVDRRRQFYEHLRAVTDRWHAQARPASTGTR